LGTIAMWIAIPLLVAFFATYLLTPLFMRRVASAGLTGRDMHKPDSPQIPEMGGISVVAGFLAGIMAYIGISTFVYGQTGPTIYILAAVTTALIYAGFKSDEFMFLGFLPKKGRKLQKLIEKIITVQEIIPETVFVAFESPLRIHETLECIEEVLPLHQLVIARELTKKFEEIHRGTASELQTTEMKGEITLIIGPSP